jgi:glycosyltransferase involved in cell wall biosynthesis
MNNIRFSIIVPLFNKEKTIINTINSVLNQTCKAFELIIVDDGSTDNSVSIVQSINDIRIRIIKQINKGVSSARNTGHKIAKGEWILFLDADDLLCDNALAHYVQLISRHKNYLVFVSNFWCKHIDVTIAHSYGRRERIVKNTMKALWYKEFYSRPGNTVIHKTVLDSIGGFDESLSYNEDYEFSIRLLTHYAVVYTPEKLMVYNLLSNEESKKHNSVRNSFSNKTETLSFNSIYRKLLLYSVVYFNGFKYNQDSSLGLYFKGIIEKMYPKYFRLVYMFFVVLRRIFLLPKSKSVLQEF